MFGYASENQLLPDTQSAYQKHRSTETATLKVLSDVYEAADSGKSVIQDGACDFRRSSRFGSWADPLPHLYCRSRTRGPKAWFQRPCICGRPANLRSHSFIGHGRPAATIGRLYRGCLHLDVLESTMPQSLEDRTHLVGIIKTASELCHGHRNERSGISRSSGRLGQGSRRAHRQRPNLV